MAEMEDLEFLTAPRQIEETQLADGTTIKNPLVVNEEINFKKEEFAKLKFQYLEQETREKFLRAILSSPPLYVEQTDIDEYEARNKEQKAELKQLKVSMNATLQNIHEKNSENVSLYHDLQSRITETDGVLKEIAELETSLHKLFPGDAQLVDAMLDQDGGDDAIYNLGGSAQHRLMEVENEQRSAEAELIKAHKKQHDRLQDIDRLTGQLENIKQEIDTASRTTSSKQDPQQFRAQWLKQMTEILQGTGIRLEASHVHNDKYKVSASTGEKHVEKELNAADLTNGAVRHFLQ